MKRWLILLALISTPVFSAENWDRTQLNLKLQKNDWSIKYREYVAGLDSDGEVDKFHWQMSYKYDNWRFDYQYWEKNGKVELRPRFQVKIKPNGSKKITIKPGFWYVMDNDYNTKNLYATFQLDVKF